MRLNHANALSTGNLTINGGALTKTDAGILTFSGVSANTLSGVITVDAGQLRLNNSSGNSVAGNLTINSGDAQLLAGNQIADTSAVTVSGTLDLNGHSDTIGC